LLLFILIAQYATNAQSIHISFPENAMSSNNTIVVKASDPIKFRITPSITSTNITNTVQDKTLSWDDLEIVLGRRIHVVAVSEHLDVLVHVHPEDFMSNTGMGNLSREMGVFEVHPWFPKAGLYIMAIEFQPKSTAEYDGGMVMFTTHVLVLSGDELGAAVPMSPEHLRATRTTTTTTFVGLPFPNGDGANGSDPDVFRDPINISGITISNPAAVSHGTVYRATLNITGGDSDAPTGSCRIMTFTFSRRTNTGGYEPVTDLEPYLYAYAHTTNVDEGMSWIGHAHALLPSGGIAATSCAHSHHGEMDMHSGHDGDVVGGDGETHKSEMVVEKKQFGPSVVVPFEFPLDGVYRIFVQARRGGDMLVAAFM
ncbi:hypothetical protein HK102_008190, partial [Quaeritorhiza haematococci]